MSRDADLSAEHGEVANRRASRNSDLRDQQRALADLHVVGNLNEVVDFRSRADERSFETRPVYACVRADFNVVFHDHLADLRHFDMLAVNEDVSVAVRADNRPRLQADALAELAVVHDDRRREEEGVFADFRESADVVVALQDRAVADNRALANRDVGADEHVFADKRLGVYCGGRVDSRLGLGPESLLHDFAELGKLYRRVVHAHDCRALGERAVVVAGQENRARLCGGHFVGVFFVAEESQVGRLRLFEACDSRNFGVRIARNFGVCEELDDFFYGIFLVHCLSLL